MKKSVKITEVILQEYGLVKPVSKGIICTSAVQEPHLQTPSDLIHLNIKYNEQFKLVITSPGWITMTLSTSLSTHLQAFPNTVSFV